MAEPNKKYFVDVFQDIINHIVLAYDPIVTVGDPPITTGGEKPYGMYGHIKRVLALLSEKDKGKTAKYQKYPLIVLVQDFEEQHGKELANEYLISPRILILAQTERNYISSARYTNVLKPTLYVLYDLLLQEMADNPNLNTGLKSQIAHKKIDRVEWGTQDAGSGLNDSLDGIDITFTDLRVFTEILETEIER